MPVARRAKPFQQSSHLGRDLWLGWGAEIGKGWRTFGPIPWLLHLRRAKFPDKGFHLRGTLAARCQAVRWGIDSPWGQLRGQTLRQLCGRACNWSHRCHDCRLLRSWDCRKPTLASSASAPSDNPLSLLRLDPLVLEATSRWEDLGSGCARLLAVRHQLLKAGDRVGRRGASTISSDIQWDTSFDRLIVDAVILRSGQCIIRLLPPSSHILPELAIQLHLFPSFDHARFPRIPEVSLPGLDIRLHAGLPTSGNHGWRTKERIEALALLLLYLVVHLGNCLELDSLWWFLATRTSGFESWAFPEASLLVLPCLGLCCQFIGLHPGPARGPATKSVSVSLQGGRDATSWPLRGTMIERGRAGCPC